MQLGQVIQSHAVPDYPCDSGTRPANAGQMARRPLREHGWQAPHIMKSVSMTRPKATSPDVAFGI